MKCRIHIATQGWLPQDPYIPSHLKTASNKHRQISKVKIVAGSTLLLIGLLAFTASFALMTTHTLLTWDETRVLNPGEQNRALWPSIYNTANCDKQPTHDGKIIVNGGTVEFTVQDSKDSRQIISTTIDDTYSFSIPANEDYNFVIQNVGSQKASVNLELETMAPFVVVPLMIGSVALLVTALPGTVLIISGRKGKKAPC
jgi:hypothetical protein